MKTFKKRSGFSIVTGPYIKRIFVDELGAAETSIINYVPKEDFGGTAFLQIARVNRNKNFSCWMGNI